LQPPACRTCICQDRLAAGPEASPLTAFAAIEELSKADGSVGWCAMISSDIAQFVGWLEPSVAAEVGHRPVSYAGSLRPLGRATPVPGGYRVSGQWNFASGIDNAQWLYAPCILMDGEKPLMTPAGTPAVRVMWLPISAATIKDTWSVMGLRGTGSQDFVIDDVFVPQNFTSFLGDRSYERQDHCINRA
jgi:indole-3-acetate monooxygenase